MLAVLGSTDFAYRLVFFLHIASVLVAFAPNFVWPTVNARLRGRGGVPTEVSAVAVRGSLTIHGPAIVLAGFFGLVMVIMSDSIFEFSQAWISGAFLVWFALLGVTFGLALPAERKAAAGDADAAGKAAMFTGINHLLLVVMLVLMIWKPGFPS